MNIGATVLCDGVGAVDYYYDEPAEEQSREKALSAGGEQPREEKRKRSAPRGGPSAPVGR